MSVRPGRAGTLRLTPTSAPDPAEGAVLVDTLWLGICGTDREIAAGALGRPPTGEDDLVLGHEVVGRIAEAPESSELTAGQLVTVIVRRPVGTPCRNCAAGNWDLCMDGHFTEHGIFGRHGFGRRQFRIEPDAVVPVPADLGMCGVLVEPASVVAKAWQHIDHLTRRVPAATGAVLVTGAGPIGLLAALLSTQRGHETYLLDRTGGEHRQHLAAAVGAHLVVGSVDDLDISPAVVVEATGSGSIVRSVVHAAAPNAVVCLLGVCASSAEASWDVGLMNNVLVHSNKLLFGSVSASRTHYDLAIRALQNAPPEWLDRMITRRLPVRHAMAAFDKEPEDIKTVIDFTGHGPSAAPETAGAS
ncbi:threonine dehydrogenase-like Zn-dependent dehydrogenase [Nonomuraea polychroma]|uniref:Threonine dehydrogenase-like Zn-dependent dehydrogenase n=1 Tax=Nonomuraea polychroma TaxID=46176 RepID=A0A438MDU2_9ACTN|nr:alcohol dehydrogenase catalytic domain-containing protein [Nonomuraea polychroma]RVX43916.1 threonine dehydrogenase-like Zn-dependent dehydrogenase [Nonomuraea polychroma]